MEDHPQEEQLSEKAAQTDQIDFFKLGVLFEGGLILLALVLGYFGFYDRNQPLNDLDPAERLQPAFLWGLIGLIPMLVLLLATLRSEWALFRSMRRTVRELLVPLVMKLRFWEMAVIAFLAGLGEELLFRWSLQGGLTEMLQFSGGQHVAILLVGLVFGVCHFITPVYALLTALIGVYLGYLMVWSGTYLAPVLTHAIYDLIALLAIFKMGNEMSVNTTYPPIEAGSGQETPENS